VPQWIEIVKWDDYQHYKNRRPIWIKLYTDLLDNDDYLALSPGERNLLTELWMLYAVTGARVPLDTRSLSRRLQHRTTSQQLRSLVEAGFLRIRASKPQANWLPRSRDIKDLHRDLQKSYGQI